MTVEVDIPTAGMFYLHTLNNDYGTVGTLVHSEIWNNLEKLEFESHLKSREFRVIVAIDEIFRGFDMKAHERKMKRGGKPDEFDAIRAQAESFSR